MKNFKTLFSALVLLFMISFSANAANAIVKTMALSQGIDGVGIVRLVVKISPSATGPDMGFTLHEAEPAGPWNDGMAIGMIDFTNEAGGIYLAGYNAGTWDRTDKIKAVEAGKQIALWISIDAANNLHGLSAQMEGETEITTVYSDYGDRESIKGANTATTANFCSVFVNDKDGATTSDIEIIKDAEIVTAIEAYTFETSAGISQTQANDAIQLCPSIAQNEITILSELAISSVSVVSINGQEMLSSSNSKVEVSGLNAGIYLVKVTTIDGNITIKRFVKQ